MGDTFVLCTISSAVSVIKEDPFKLFGELRNKMSDPYGWGIFIVP